MKIFLLQVVVALAIGLASFVTFSNDCSDTNSLVPFSAVNVVGFSAEGGVVFGNDDGRTDLSSSEYPFVPFSNCSDDNLNVVGLASLVCFSAVNVVGLESSVNKLNGGPPFSAEDGVGLELEESFGFGVAKKQSLTSLSINELNEGPFWAEGGVVFGNDDCGTDLSSSENLAKLHNPPDPFNWFSVLANLASFLPFSNCSDDNLNVVGLASFVNNCKLNGGPFSAEDGVGLELGNCGKNVDTFEAAVFGNDDGGTIDDLSSSEYFAKLPSFNWFSVLAKVGVTFLVPATNRPLVIVSAFISPTPVGAASPIQPWRNQLCYLDSSLVPQNEPGNVLHEDEPGQQEVLKCHANLRHKSVANRRSQMTDDENDSCVEVRIKMRDSNWTYGTADYEQHHCSAAISEKSLRDYYWVDKGSDQLLKRHCPTQGRNARVLKSNDYVPEVRKALRHFNGVASIERVLNYLTEQGLWFINAWVKAVFYPVDKNHERVFSSSNPAPERKHVTFHIADPVPQPPPSQAQDNNVNEVEAEPLPVETPTPLKFKSASTATRCSSTPRSRLRGARSPHSNRRGDLLNRREYRRERRRSARDAIREENDANRKIISEGNKYISEGNKYIQKGIEAIKAGDDAIKAGYESIKDCGRYVLDLDEAEEREEEKINDELRELDEEEEYFPNLPGPGTVLDFDGADYSPPRPQQVPPPTLKDPPPSPATTPNDNVARMPPRLPEEDENDPSLNVAKKLQQEEWDKISESQKQQQEVDDDRKPASKPSSKPAASPAESLPVAQPVVEHGSSFETEYSHCRNTMKDLSQAANGPDEDEGLLEEERKVYKCGKCGAPMAGDAGYCSNKVHDPETGKLKDCLGCRASSCKKPIGWEGCNGASAVAQQLRGRENGEMVRCSGCEFLKKSTEKCTVCHPPKDTSESPDTSESSGASSQTGFSFGAGITSGGQSNGGFAFAGAGPSFVTGQSGGGFNFGAGPLSATGSNTNGLGGPSVAGSDTGGLGGAFANFQFGGPPNSFVESNRPEFTTFSFGAGPPNTEFNFGPTEFNFGGFGDPVPLPNPESPVPIPLAPRPAPRVAPVPESQSSPESAPELEESVPAGDAPPGTPVRSFVEITVGSFVYVLVGGYWLLGTVRRRTRTSVYVTVKGCSDPEHVVVVGKIRIA